MNSLMQGTTPKDLNSRKIYSHEIKEITGGSHGGTVKDPKLSLRTQKATQLQVLDIHQLNTVIGGSDGLLKIDPKITKGE